MSNKMKTFTRYPGRIALGVGVVTILLILAAGITLAKDNVNIDNIFLQAATPNCMEDVAGTGHP